jgi:HD superfamily phosphohydrolase
MVFLLKECELLRVISHSFTLARMTGYKIFNDPLYGFLTVPRGLLLELIDHPWMQRLHRIRQLGLSYLVYPGALHTRFHHALGALHLVQQAIEVLKRKGVKITEHESLAVQAAVLLHDIGHGPFSHSLEGILIPGLDHEKLTRQIIYRLNEEFQGRLSLTIDIFENRYDKPFLHNLVAGQLDMDRLDYLNRDSFYTGVSEGVISSERIIKMLNVHDDRLVVEEKGIYSIENFLIARRLMYWQVYLHKTVLAAEQLLIRIIKRAREVYTQARLDSHTPSALSYFLKMDKPVEQADAEMIGQFNRLDDADIFTAIKEWMHGSDAVLRQLCTMLIHRRLYKIRLGNRPVEPQEMERIKNEVSHRYRFNDDELRYFAFEGSVTNSAYNHQESILIAFKDGTLRDIAEASDLPNISVMSTEVRKYFICYLP